MATKKVPAKRVPQPGVDWATAPGPKGVHKKRQKALMVGFLTVVTNKHFSNNKIPLVNYAQIDGPTLKAATIVDSKPQAATLAPGQDYIDMKQVYKHLRPLTTDQVNKLIVLARSNSASFQKMAQSFWEQGESIAPYPHGDEHCPSAIDALTINR